RVAGRLRRAEPLRAGEDVRPLRETGARNEGRPAGQVGVLPRGGAQVNVETAIREIKVLKLTPDTVVVIRTDNFDEALADEFRRQINAAGRPFKVPIVLLPAHD